MHDSRKLLAQEDEECSTNTRATEPGPSRTNTEKNKASGSTAVPPQKIYPMFRELLTFLGKNSADYLIGNNRASTDASSTSLGTERLPTIPDIVPPVISSPDVVPARIMESISNATPQYESNIGSELDDDDDDRLAEDTPAPEGVVQNYLDRIQKEVHAQIEGDGKQPDCYRNGTFWICPRDNWFALDKDKDSPDMLYYPRVFVWVPSVLVSKDFEFTCVFCGKDKMGQSGEYLL